MDYVLLVVGTVLGAGALQLWLRRAGRRDPSATRLWLALALVLVGGHYLTTAAGERERLRIQEMIEGFAPTYAQEMERLGHAAIDTSTSPDDPTYLSLIEAEKRWLAVNPAIADVYTLRKLADGRNVFVVDSETDYDHDGRYHDFRESRTPIGQVYEKALPALERAFGGSAAFTDEIYSDGWGRWVSAFVPMRDSSGAVESVLGVNYDAETWVRAVSVGRALAIGALTVVLVILLSGGAVLAITRADLAERARAEATVRRVNADLERRVQARTAELEALSQQMELILTSVGEGICGVDLEGRVTFVNPAAAQMLGRIAAELIGERFVTIARPGSGDIPALTAPHPTDAPYRADDESFSRSDGQTFPVEYVSTPIRTGGRVVGGVVLFRNITERKLVETELRRAKDIAEATAQAKNDFLASMSHEIRTPLNIVLGMTEMLGAWELAAEQDNCVRTIRKSTLSLLAIVDDILDMSRIEAGRLVLAEVDFDLRTVIDDVIELFAHVVYEKELRLEASVAVGVPERLVGDPARLRQVLMNLVGNAIKFTERGLVQLGADLIAEDRTHVRIQLAVKDTGIGIPLEAQGRIFDSFVRVDTSSTSRYGGTGLGLTICRTLVGLMGGQTGVESVPGQGSTFWVVLSLPKARVTSASVSGAIDVDRVGDRAQ